MFFLTESRSRLDWGIDMREINVSIIEEAVARLCIEANTCLGEDVREAVRRAAAEEKSPSGKEILMSIDENSEYARANAIAVCQDTGMVVIFAEIGQEVHLVGGGFEDAINRGVAKGYTEGYLRCSIVSDPLKNRENTNDNTPAVIYTRIVEGDRVSLLVAPKGFGSENMSSLIMMTPAATRESMIDRIVAAVERAGSNPCPPVVIGVGIGGTADKAAYLAKHALTRDLDMRNEDEYYADMEREILRRVNALGIGPQGLGGSVTALACAIETYPTHIAGLPVSVCIGCHVNRHMSIIL